MRFDFTERYVAYQRIGRAVALLGLDSRHIGRGSGYDCLVVGVDLSDRDKSIVVVNNRYRGWFVTIQGEHFRVENEEQVIKVCENLRSQLTKDSHQLTVDSELGLVGITRDQWSSDEQGELMDSWRKHGWHSVNYDEANQLSSSFWQWRLDNLDLPTGIVTDIPSRSWVLRELTLGPDSRCEAQESQLTLAVLQSLRKTVAPTDSVLALDEYRACFEFFPHAQIRRATRNEWAIPVVPLENSRFFFARDFSFGLIGDYLSNTIIAFGDPLVRHLQDSVDEIIEPIPKDVRWSKMLWKSRVSHFSAMGWEVLSPPEGASSWQTYSEVFGGRDFEPFCPSATWDITEYFEQDTAVSEQLEVDIAVKVHSYIRSSVASGQSWVALSHINPDCRFEPSLEMDATNLNDWAISLIPRYERLHLFTTDGSTGLFADNRLGTITVCGSDFMRFLDDNRPLVLSREVSRF